MGAVPRQKRRGVPVSRQQAKATHISTTPTSGSVRPGLISAPRIVGGSDSRNRYRHCAGSGRRGSSFIGLKIGHHVSAAVPRRLAGTASALWLMSLAVGGKLAGVVLPANAVVLRLE